ncbi:hypothetical protein [Pisciglobus halotolerans]|uniref:Uncharacterized protein n=1 Tax=Pisciglobus halotolerans TaxID=745365 RepID=A0A1I3C1V4_9LACT|nr:hypothetical protein [Pisciglobus halotolerans]SFH68482.1 hypothetical protein SAMN04489868_11223 [Pisciglobus halotolerans]
MIEFKNNIYDLSIAGLRRMLHEALDEEFYNVFEDPQEDEQEELQKAHELISAQDATKLAEHMIGYDISFMLVKEKDMIEEVLKESGYEVEKSNVSRSLYAINDSGEEVRISDHKRPAYQVKGAVGYVEHEYEKELIVEENKVTKAQLINVGFSRLGQEEYFLG